MTSREKKKPSDKDKEKILGKKTVMGTCSLKDSVLLWKSGYSQKGTFYWTSVRPFPIYLFDLVAMDLKKTAVCVSPSVDELLDALPDGSYLDKDGGEYVAGYNLDGKEFEIRADSPVSALARLYVGLNNPSFDAVEVASVYTSIIKEQERACKEDVLGKPSTYVINKNRKTGKPKMDDTGFLNLN